MFYIFCTGYLSIPKWHISQLTTEFWHFSKQKNEQKEKKTIVYKRVSRRSFMNKVMQAIN